MTEVLVFPRRRDGPRAPSISVGLAPTPAPMPAVPVITTTENARSDLAQAVREKWASSPALKGVRAALREAGVAVGEVYSETAREIGLGPAYRRAARQAGIGEAFRRVWGEAPESE